MPIKLNPPIIKDYLLTESDKRFKNTGDPTKILVRQAAQGECELRNAVFSEFRREYHADDSVTVTQRISYDDVVRTEVMLTLAGCNILDEDGEPLFVFKGHKVADENAFAKAWAKLDPFIANEMHEKVLELNLLWSEQGKK